MNKMATSNGGNGRRVKKTPYQGPSRCHGWFDCDFGHRWDSKTSWANYGQKCKTCVKNGQQKRVTASQAFMIPYTYPHTQLPLHEIWLYCGCCHLEVEAMSPKTKNCTRPGCQGVLEPWNYLQCPNCRYHHCWAEDLKTARELEFRCKDFVCKDFAHPPQAVDGEECSGCDSVIGINKRTEGSTTGAVHLDILCEKCHELGHKCTHSRQRISPLLRDENNNGNVAVKATGTKV